MPADAWGWRGGRWRWTCGVTPMGWEVRGRRRCYTRSRKVGGRVFREYVGFGPAAELAAEADALRRAERQDQAQALRADQVRWEAANLLLRQFSGGADFLAQAALLCGGYLRHDRGEW